MHKNEPGTPLHDMELTDIQKNLILSQERMISYQSDAIRIFSLAAKLFMAVVFFICLVNGCLYSVIAFMSDQPHLSSRFAAAANLTACIGVFVAFFLLRKYEKAFIRLMKGCKERKKFRFESMQNVETTK